LLAGKDRLNLSFPGSFFKSKKVTTQKNTNNPMPTQVKRIMFFSLFALFLVYTFFIVGRTTDFSKGSEANTREAKQGKLLFQKYNCISCHQVYGLGGYMGPDLTNVMSAPGKGDAYARALLKHGTRRMPDFHLSEDEINALSAYLNYVDKTGLSPVKEFSVHPSGTILMPVNEE
jgi:nitric oxide reductase subunit C